MWDVCTHQQKPEAVYKNFDIYYWVFFCPVSSI